jgi:hypothetical protein
MAVWESKVVKEKLKALLKGHPIIWDGNKIAW